MNFERISPNGSTLIPVYVASWMGKKMQRIPFLMDTGATRTTINKVALSYLGYTDEWLSQNKIALAPEEQPILADGSKLDSYGVPAMRFTIAGHEIHHDSYFLTSDVAPQLGYLLGADILSYFDVFFKYSEWRTYYEFRKDRVLIPKEKGNPFAYEAVKIFKSPPARTQQDFAPALPKTSEQEK